MSKRLANILDASLPSPPDVGHFLYVLEQWQKIECNPVSNVTDPVHGNLFHAPKKASGSAGTEKAGVACAVQFGQLCKHLGATYSTLDSFFVAWGQWVLKPEELFDTAEEEEECRLHRERQAAGLFKVYNVPVGSFRTYCNAVARAFSAQSSTSSTAAVGSNALVPSSKKQFPQFNVFLNEVITRSKVPCPCCGCKGSHRRFAAGRIAQTFGFPSRQAV